MKKLESFVRDMAEGVEKQYACSLYDVVVDFKIDTSSREQAIGLLFFLESCDLIVGDFNTVTHPGGSLNDNSRFVLNMFEGLRLTEFQLRHEFNKATEDEFSTVYAEMIEWWRTQFLESPKVEKVIC